ncbi:MAG: S46 family peptidase [Gammaproteobacteria bacterium]
MKKLICLIAGVVLLTPAAFAGAGMWTLDNPPTATLQQKFGFTPSKAWIRHVQLASVRFPEGCSGSFVSPNGLVLTNHHCVVGCLEALSSQQNNLMAKSFYAASDEKELKCPAMQVEQLVSTTNVTGRMDKATAGKSGAAYNTAQKAFSSKLQQGCVNGHSEKWDCEIVTLYHGGQFWLYKYRRYNDARLVFAPSQQTAFFGGYPDNFNYPRYDFDLSFVRVYVDGKPAKTPEYFKISPKGPKTGELVFTSGNPGSTERNLTVTQLENLRYPVLPARLQYLLQYEGLLKAWSAGSAEHARVAQEDLFFVGNSIKVYRGMLAALHNPREFDLKQKRERTLQARVDADPKLKAKYADAWRDITEAGKKSLAMQKSYAMIVRGNGFMAKLYNIAFALVLGAHERSLPDAQRLARFRDANLPAVEQSLFSDAPVYPDFDKLRLGFSLTVLRNTLGPDAPISDALFARYSPHELAKRSVEGTGLAKVSVRKELWKGGEQAIKTSDDPMIELARKVLPFWLKYHHRYQAEVAAPLKVNAAKIARARFAIHGTSIYPDATFTERLSWGVVKGWPRDGNEVPPFTHIQGLYRHAKGYPPLALSKPWLAAKGALKPTLSMDMVTTNDIVGGNSGSPVIDRNGGLVGLAFDGNPPSIGGAFWYNGQLNRTVAVDSAVILAGLKKVYHANALVSELTGGVSPASPHTGSNSQGVTQ